MQENDKSVKIGDIAKWRIVLSAQAKGFRKPRLTYSLHRVQS